MVKIHTEIQKPIKTKKIKRKRKRKRKSSINIGRQKPVPLSTQKSKITTIYEKYKKRKWLVRTVFITKCIVSVTLIILEFVL